VSDVEIDEEDEFEDIEQVLFQGPMYGREADLKKNPRLVQAGLIPVKKLITDGLSRRAHTIVVEPKGPRQVVRYTIDGIAYPAGVLPGKLGIAVIQMVKLLAGLDVQSRVTEQSGGILAEFDEQQYRLLVETTPVRGAVERLRIRVSNVKDSFNAPGDIDFPEDLRAQVRDMTEDATGIILSCGPPESGVTSLSMVVMHCVDSYLYSVYNVADLGDQSLMNVSEVDAEEGADLEIKLDRIIRQEGDAVYVGQVNDPKEAQLLFDYSEKLCFIGEIDSKTPAEAVKQLIDWVGVDKVLANLKGVICQKLIRRLCDDCKQAFRPAPRLLKQLRLPPETTVLYRAPQPPDPDDEDAPTVEELCADCNGVPYHGRAAVYEFFEMTEPMREVIVEGGNAIAIRKQMAEEKQRMLQQDALRLVVNGTTSLEELRRAFGGGGKGRPRGGGRGRPSGGGKGRPSKRRPRPQ